MNILYNRHMVNSNIPFEVLAWVAGLIDGEGCIYIRKRTEKAPSRKERSPSYALSLTVKMTHKPTIEELKNIFGVGRIHRETPGKLNKKVSWRWAVSTQEGADILRMILPYLKVKREEAELAIEFSEVSKRSSFGRNTVKVEISELRDSFYRKLQELKKQEWN